MANTTENTVQENAPVEITQGPMEPIQLSVGDIEIAVRAIDVAAERGSYHGWGEIAEVLTLRNRLVTFLKSLPQPTEAAPAAETGATDEVPESPGA